MLKIKEESYDDYIHRIFHLGNNGKRGARTVTLQVTDGCNLACTYCYQINKHTNMMPIEVAKKFIDDLLDGKYNNYCDYDNSEAIILEFIGGEPFIAIDLISEITDYFVNSMIERDHPWLFRYRISICSNGVLYFDPRVQEYIQKHHKHMSFSISIDGNKELHDACRVFPDGSGSYDIAMAGVKHYVENYSHYSMGSKMTIAPENVTYVYEAVKSLIENGYTDINLNCVYEEGWNEKYATILYEQLKQLTDYIVQNNLYEKVALSIFDKNAFQPMREDDLQNWCGGTGQMLACDWRGDLYPCIRYMESSLGDSREPICIGNVWNGIMATEHQCQLCNDLNCIDRRTQSTDECFYCPIAKGCSWCSAYNYQMFGTANKRATFICIMHKARSLANAYYWNKVYIAEQVNKRFKIWLPDEEALKIIDEKELKFLHMLEHFPPIFIEDKKGE